VDGWERRGKSTSVVLPMLFFGWKNMRCRRFNIAVTIPNAAFLGNGAAVRVLPYSRTARAMLTGKCRFSRSGQRCL
jgi:hypothetical protein